jgi:uncharacterized protein YceK
MKRTLILLVGLTTVGCSSAYTSIQPTGAENEYYVTGVEQGFWKVNGTVYRCQAAGNKMNCVRVDSR